MERRPFSSAVLGWAPLDGAGFLARKLRNGAIVRFTE